MLSPEAQAQVAAHEQLKRDRALGVVPRFDSRLGARTHGDMLMAGWSPGVEVYARTEGDNARQRWDGEARGGIVLEVVDMSDPETGEMYRAFKTFDYDPACPMHRAVSILTEAQLDVDRFEPFHLGHCRSAARRIGRWLGSQRGLFTVDELELWRAGYILARILMGVTA